MKYAAFSQNCFWLKKKISKFPIKTWQHKKGVEIAGDLQVWVSQDKILRLHDSLLCLFFEGGFSWLQA